MFGLWYLSLAITGFRKYLGWTSFFDVFTTKRNDDGGNRGIESKSNVHSQKNDEPKVSDAKPKEEEPKKQGKTVEPKSPVAPISMPAVSPKPSDPLKPAEPKFESKIVIPRPTMPEVKPAVPEPKPVVPETKPIVPETASVTIPPKPATPEKKATTPEPKATTPEAKLKSIPKSPDVKPLVFEVKPISPKPESPKMPAKPIFEIGGVSDNSASVNTKSRMPNEPATKNEPSWMIRGSDMKLSMNNSPLNYTNGGSDFETKLENTKQAMKDATKSFLQGEGARLNSPIIEKRNKSDTMVDAAVLQKLEDGFAKLQASDSKSLLKKFLTKEVFDNLKNKKTPTFGSTLLDCIQSGIENLDSGVGIYAPDAEAYSVFAELFDPIIEDYHKGFKKTDKHPARDFGDVNAFANLDPNNEFVVSTRVRCGRSMEGYPFNPCLTEAQYKEMEDKVSSTLSGMEGELKGKFYPLTGMEKSVQQQLIDDHFLFKEGDRFLQAANACRFWPTGRGIYHNDNKTFLVWCNEEDHLRIISMQKGGDLGEVYKRLVTAVNDIEKRIPFSHHDRLGFLTFCPTNLGTTIRASVHIAVPKLAADMKKLEEIAAKYNLQVRGTRGEHTEAEGGIYDISNKRRMGLTEFQAVKEMYDGIAELIKIEKSL